MSYIGIKITHIVIVNAAAGEKLADWKITFSIKALRKVYLSVFWHMQSF